MGYKMNVIRNSVAINAQEQILFPSIHFETNAWKRSRERKEVLCGRIQSTVQRMTLIMDSTISVLFASATMAREASVRHSLCRGLAS